MRKRSIILAFFFVLPLAWVGGWALTSRREPAVVVSLVRSNGLPRFVTGAGAALMILPDGSLWQWGQMGFLQFSGYKTPRQIGANCDWIAAAAGAGRYVGLRRDGTIWQWGFDAEPQQVGSGQAWIGITTGNSHSVALKRDGSIWAWGDNTRLQLGNGPGPNRPQLAQVGTNFDWQAVSAENDQTWALRLDGTLWEWGSGRFAPVQTCRETNWTALGPWKWALRRGPTLELWNPMITTPNGAAPVAATGLLVATNWIPNRSALTHDKLPVLYELRSNGTLWSAPCNRAGNQLIPPSHWRQVGRRSDWVSIAGTGPAFGITSDGTIWTWGEDIGNPGSLTLKSRMVSASDRLRRWFGMRPVGGTLVSTTPVQRNPRPLFHLVDARPKQGQADGDHDR